MIDVDDLIALVRNYNPRCNVDLIRLDPAVACGKAFRQAARVLVEARHREHAVAADSDSTIRLCERASLPVAVPNL